jgi:hypothetical protein
MSTPNPLGLAPYISPVTLTNAPTGIDWTGIPVGDDVTAAENTVEQWNIIQRATARVDGYCNQIMRATLDTELLHGPDYRVTVGPASGGMVPTPYWGGSNATNARIILSRWPILEVTNVQVSPNAFPRNWVTVTSGYYEPEVPVIGIYGSVAPDSAAQGGQAIIVGGGFIDWQLSRNGYAIKVTYINGYPHTVLTSAVLAGATSLPVQDTTGWAIQNYFDTYTGATGIIKDSGNQETVQVSAASTTSGPGNLTVPAITYPHPAGTIITTLPASIEQACIFFAAAEALTRGATTTTIHDVGGHAQGTGGDYAGLIAQAQSVLKPFRRTI